MSHQFILEFSIPPTYNPQDFILGKSNHKAFQYVQSPKSWPIYGLILWGPSKAGKTHLSHIFHHQHGAVFCDASFFKQESFVSVIHHDSYYVIDDLDIHSISETSMFHFLNELHEKNSKVLWIRQDAPHQWNICLPDLKSRIGRMLVVSIEKPDDNLLLAALQKRAADLQIVLSPFVAQYLLDHTERSFHHLISLLDFLNLKSLQHNRKITIPFIKDQLDTDFTEGL